VFSNALRFRSREPGDAVSDTSPVCTVQAIFRRETFSRVIWLSGEKRMPPGSWPYAGQPSADGSDAAVRLRNTPAHASTTAPAPPSRIAFFIDFPYPRKRLHL